MYLSFPHRFLLTKQLRKEKPVPYTCVCPAVLAPILQVLDIQSTL